MFSYEPLCDKKRKVIFDTDIGPDCDDAGALALLLNWADKYGFEISGIVNCTSNRYASAAADAICKYYGRKNIPIGEYKPEGFNADGLRYNKYLAENFPNRFRDEGYKAEDSTELYGRILSGSEDGSVVIITVGMLNTVCAAYERYPELFAKKVYAIISMAGAYPKGHEYNIYCDPHSAEKLFGSIPVPVFFSGFELGYDIITGFDTVDSSNPVCKAYELYNDGKLKRNSWDLVTAMFAVFGESNWFGLTEQGKVYVDPVSGDNSFIPSAKGRHRFITAKVPVREIEMKINAVLSEDTPRFHS